MRVSRVCNATLLAIIAKKEEITYEELKKEYCEPIQVGVVSSRNVMFDSDLKVLELEGYIKVAGDLIAYVKRN